MTRKANVPVDAQLRARVIDLHAKGVGRNDIARLTGTSTSTVSRLVKESGASFDTTQTEVATRNRLADLAEMRSRLAVKLVAKAHDLVDDMDVEFLAYNFGGKDNTYEEHLLPKPPTASLRDLMQSATVAAKTSMEITKFDSDPDEGLSAVDEWLNHVVGGNPVD